MRSDDHLQSQSERAGAQGRSRVIGTVAAIAGGVFIIELLAGGLTTSQALKADALDFEALAATLLVSLWSAGKPQHIRVRAELAKNAALTLLGLWIALSTLHHFLIHPVPEAELMGAVGLLALVGNVAIMSLLGDAASRHAGFSALRLSARNDTIGNVSVILAAGLVALMGTAAADLVVAGVLVAVFLTTSLPALQRSWQVFDAGRRATQPNEQEGKQ